VSVLQESFPGESILLWECLLEAYRVLSRIILLSDFGFFVIVTLAITNSCSIINVEQSIRNQSILKAK
jgi:hypothetical protein